jgi:hypothetical protein
MTWSAGWRRTQWLLRAVSDEDLSRRHDPRTSPLIWDYDQVGNYEELWPLERVLGKSLSNRGSTTSTCLASPA